MAKVWMMSFDWDRLNAILAQPAAELAGRLAGRRRRGEVPSSTQSSSLPRAESDLVTFLRALLAAEDWYAGKAPREARAIDGFVDDLFHHEGPLKPLQLRPLSDGVMFEVLEIAKGYREVDDGRNTPRARDLYLRKAESRPETDVSELADLGSSPRPNSFTGRASRPGSRRRNGRPMGPASRLAAELVHRPGEPAGVP